MPLVAGPRCLPPRRPACGAVLRASPVSSASFVSTFLWPCPSLVQPYLYPRRWVFLVVVEAHLGLARVVRLADDVLVREDAGMGKTDAGAVHQRGGAIPTSERRHPPEKIHNTPRAVRTSAGRVTEKSRWIQDFAPAKFRVRNRAKFRARNFARSSRAICQKFARETSPHLRARNFATSSRAKYRHIFAREISPHLRARNVARSSRAEFRQIFARDMPEVCAARTLYSISRKSDTLLGFARTLWLLPLRTLRHETLSESVSCRAEIFSGF
jgi:hypothetical protein